MSHLLIALASCKGKFRQEKKKKEKGLYNVVLACMAASPRKRKPLYILMEDADVGIEPFNNRLVCVGSHLIPSFSVQDWTGSRRRGEPRPSSSFILLLHSAISQLSVSGFRSSSSTILSREACCALLKV